MSKKNTPPKNVLITGATNGLAKEFCKLYAANGYGLILVDGNASQLRELADSLSRDHGTRTQLMEFDPTAKNAATRILGRLQEANLRVDEMLTRAGFRIYGPFSKKDLSKEIERLCAEYLFHTPWACGPVPPYSTPGGMTQKSINRRLI